MMETNENGSKRVLILVHPASSADGCSRPAKSSQTEQGALDYALEGDALLYVFEDSTVYPMTRGATSGAGWGKSMAEFYLHSGLELEKQEIMDMCFHDDSEAALAFIDSLVDCVIDCCAEKEPEL